MHIFTYEFFTRIAKITKYTTYIFNRIYYAKLGTFSFIFRGYAISMYMHIIINIYNHKG